ncbi:MAG: hydrogenase maturation protease [Candidatus Diapherotrites archaeon]|nr:hydrogenase maturation protease [Candidatus Diapherotrites archaeon]
MFEPKGPARKISMLIGMGQELNGDDAIGCAIADNFSERDWLAVNAGTVPENFTGMVKRERPSTLVIVDAAEMGLPAGEIRRIEKSKANSAFYSTHSIPVSQTIAQIEPYVKEVVLIGIQPNTMQQFKRLSPQATEAAKKLMALLKSNRLEEIKRL